MGNILGESTAIENIYSLTSIFQRKIFGGISRSAIYGRDKKFLKKYVLLHNYTISAAVMKKEKFFMQKQDDEYFSSKLFQMSRSLSIY